MKNWIFLSTAILLVSGLFSCNYQSRSERRAYNEQEITQKAFREIKLTGGYDVELIQGEVESLVLMTKSNSTNDIKYWVEDSVLYIRNETKGIRTNDIDIQLNFKELRRISIEGGANLKNKDTLNFDTLNITVEGAANIRLNLNVNHLESRAAGGVNMEFAGKANSFNAVTEGAGNIDADHMETKVVTCRVSGVGNASVYATEELNATVEGVGKIAFRGNPVVNKTISGIGVVYKQ